MYQFLTTGLTNQIASIDLSSWLLQAAKDAENVHDGAGEDLAGGEWNIISTSYTELSFFCLGIQLTSRPQMEPSALIPDLS